MARPAIYRILEIPWVYSLSQAVLAPGQRWLDQKFFAKIYTEPKELSLDVGCGPRVLRPVGGGKVVGVDLNPEYVARYTGGWVDTDLEVVHARGSQRTRFGFACSADSLPFRDGLFDEVRCERLLHHLTDRQAADAVREMERCLRPGGRIVLMDIVFPRRAWRRPVAWTMLKLDRGEWVRREEELRRLVAGACPGDWSATRYTCNYLGVEALALLFHKAPALGERGVA
jgi:SAM-dependent methyltransferase